MKISSFVEYTSTYETNQARRDSWIQHQLNYGRRPRAKKQTTIYIYHYIIHNDYKRCLCFIVLYQ